jgi:hypothetical protein
MRSHPWRKSAHGHRQHKLEAANGIVDTKADAVTKQEDKMEKASEDEEDDDAPKRDLVEELIGEEKDDAHTHRPDGTYEILNEVVVDRGPNPSKCNTYPTTSDNHD